MFDRFVRLTQARRALGAGRPEEALRLLADPLIAAHRRTDEVRAQALDRLVARAGTRAADGDLSGAAADLQAVVSWQPERGQVAAMLREVREKMAAAESHRGEVEIVRREVRDLIDAGDLRAAEACLGAATALAGAEPELALAHKSIAARRARAAQLLEQVRQALVAEDAPAARDLLRQAAAADRHAAGLAAMTLEVAAALGRAVAAAVQADLARGAVASACERLARERALLPELGERREVAAAQREVVAALRAPIEQHLRAGRLGEAVAAFAQIDARLLSEQWLGEFPAAMADLRDGLAAIAAGNASEAVARLTHAAAVLPAPAVAAARKAAADEAKGIAAAVEDARARVTTGDLLAARQVLERGLARWPLARPLHEEMKVLDESALERQRRLGAARQAANAGRLREAAAQALALACPGDLGDEARRLQAEIQAKLDVVAAGVDQVKRAVHGRSSGSSEGLAHCIGRLDELARVQADHDELPRLRAALEHERQGLELIRETIDGCRAKLLRPAVLDGVRAAVALRSGLLSIDRLDARLLEVVDAVSARGEAEVAAGCLSGARLCIEAVGSLASALPAEARRADDLSARVGAAQAEAEAAVVRGRAALSARDMDGAESALAEARSKARDDDRVAALERDVEELRARLHQLQEVRSMADKKEFARAQEKLAGLPPTPAALRTKIFDLKRSLAQAQGLDGGFVLRVDEGGEFLVLRRDSLSIGNLRDGRADLVVLANIAGQHARLQRRMSFHGGMEDRIVADRGEVSVNGTAVREQRLRDGDEICLAGQLRLCYRVPSSRSLTTLVRVLGGFQVRGTDKVLLMKDRGRDGRILIGNSKDAHVPVAVEGPEVELYGGLDGQIRVRCAGNGTIDGRPFTGEHPVVAGAVVACGSVAFVLLPIVAS